MPTARTATTAASLTAAGVAAAVALVLAPTSQGTPTAAAAPPVTTNTVRAFDVPNLDQKVVAAYDKFISIGADGRFKANIPADRFFTDAKGAWAATNAVTRANYLVDKQRMALIAHGATLQEAMGATAVKDGTASKVLPMGEHATFQADWWGMTFTLDKVAADQLAAGLTKTQDAGKLLALLSAVGVTIAPEVTAIVSAVLGAIALANTVLKSNITQDGVVIKALWIPIPWAEKPKGPFTPAPQPSNGPTVVPGPDAVTVG